MLTQPTYSGDNALYADRQTDWGSKGVMDEKHATKAEITSFGTGLMAGYHVKEIDK